MCDALVGQWRYLLGSPYRHVRILYNAFEEQSLPALEEEMCSIFIRYATDVQIHQSLGAWGGFLWPKERHPNNPQETQRSGCWGW